VRSQSDDWESTRTGPARTSRPAASNQARGRGIRPGGNAFSDAFGNADDNGGVAEENVSRRKSSKPKKKANDTSSSESSDGEEEEVAGADENTVGDDADEAAAEPAKPAPKSDEPAKKKSTVTITKLSKKQKRNRRQAKLENAEGDSRVASDLLNVQIIEKTKKSSLVLAIENKEAVSLNRLNKGFEALDMTVYEEGLVVSLSKSLEQGKFSMKECLNILDKFLDEEYVAELFTNVVSTLTKRTSQLKVTELVAESKMEASIVDSMRGPEPKGSVDAFLDQHGVLFLKPAEELLGAVVVALQEKTKPSKIISMLDESAGKGVTPVGLIPTVGDYISSIIFVKKPTVEPVRDVALVLRRLVQEDPLMQAELLFNIQANWFKAKVSDKTFIKTLFMALHEHDVISEAGFDTWRQTKNSVPGKAKALLKVNSWISEMMAALRKAEESDEESDEEESDEDDDVETNPNIEFYR
jgi:hypothetical protein